MNLNTNTILLGFLIVAVPAYFIFKPSNQANSVDEELANKEAQLSQSLEGPVGDPLSNNSATLKTLVISNKSFENQLKEKDIELESLRKQVDTLARAQSNSSGANITDVQMNINNLIAKQEILIKEMAQLRQENEQLKLTPTTNPALIDPLNDQTQGMVDSGVSPTNVTPIDTQEEAPIYTRFVQPALEKTGLSGSGQVKAEDFLDENIPDSDGLVWVKQSDLTEVKDKEGKVTRVYAKTFTDDGVVDTNAFLASNVEGKNKGDDTQEILNMANAANNKEDSGVPLYTIPPNATFFGTVGMSAIIGKVPLDNNLENPYRFKVLVGGDNLASNNHYIPGLDNMVLSGFAEGDFTMECARGTIDTALFTFRDGTVRVVKGAALGHIADAYGTPCLPGQYITNFPDYVTKKASLAMLGSIASSLADSVTTTTTTAEGITTSVVNDSLKKALGDGGESAASEVTEWFEKRQTSAFDVVFLPTGQDLVINIDDFINIDYEVDGRKLYHKDNAKEYKL